MAAQDSVEDLAPGPRRARLPGRRGPGHRRVPRPRACAGRCCSRARPAWARPRWPRCWPRWTGGELLRLQCYEGIDVVQAVYEWDYSRQLLHLRAAEAAGRSSAVERGRAVEDELYSERFLVRRPLLRAIAHARGPAAGAAHRRGRPGRRRVRGLPARDPRPTTRSPCPSSAPFRADVPPIVVITSNRTRDVHDALKRRCLYHWVEHPDFEREVAIVRLRVPEVAERAGPPGGGGRRARSASSASTSRRAWPRPSTGPRRSPSLGRTELDVAAVDATLGTVLKYREDQQRVRARTASASSSTAAARGAEPTRRPPAPGPTAVAVVAFARAPAPGRASSVPVGTRRRASPRPWPLVGAVDERAVYWAGRATLVRRPEDLADLRRGLRRLLAGGARRAVAARPRSTRDGHRG